MKEKLVNVLKFIGCLVLWDVMGSPLGYLMRHQDSLTLLTAWAASLLYFLAIVGVIFWLWWYYRKQRAAKALKLKDIGVALLFGLLARVVAVVGGLLILYLTHQVRTGNDAIIFDIAGQLKHGFLPISLLFLLQTSLIAPITEELIFRGLFTELLFKNGSKWIADLLSSALFAVFHVHSFAPLEFLLYSALGGILYLSYARRGEIKDSILVHALNNFLPTLVYAFTIFL